MRVTIFVNCGLLVKRIRITSHLSPSAQKAARRAQKRAVRASHLGRANTGCSTSVTSGSAWCDSASRTQSAPPMRCMDRAAGCQKAYAVRNAENARPSASVRRHKSLLYNDFRASTIDPALCECNRRLKTGSSCRAVSVFAGVGFSVKLLARAKETPSSIAMPRALALIGVASARHDGQRLQQDLEVEQD